MTDQAGPLFEVAPRDVISAPVRRWWPARWRVVALLVPAGVVLTAGLAAPFVATVIVSVAAGPAGAGNYARVLTDPAVGHAVANSVRWVIFSVAVCLAGLLVAWLGRRAGRAWRIAIGMLAVPVAVSAFVAGVAFLLLFAPLPGNGAAGGLAAAAGVHSTFLGPGSWIWVVLCLAFGWQWLGLAAVVFRTRLAGLPTDLLRVARAFGAGRFRQARAVALPALFPAGALVLIIVLVAAARVFELLLVIAPGADQDTVDVVGVHLWRFGADLGAGESAALAVLLSAFVAVVALAGLWGLSREWPAGQQPAVDVPASHGGPDTGRRAAPDAVPDATGRQARTLRLPHPRRVLTTTSSVLATAVWALPLVALLFASLHDPSADATRGWWSGGWGLGSYRDAFADGQLLPALGATAERALLASALLLVLAAPAAYALAWGRLPAPLVRALIAVIAVLAVLPPQAVAIPLGFALDRLQLLGASAPLVGVHVAFGLPFATLLLRGAFTSVPRALVRERQADPVPASALMTVLTRCWPALLAVAVVELVAVWNDLLIGLLFGGTEAGQATLVLFEQTREFATSAGPLAAGAVLITAVPLVLVLASGRWLVRGLAEGVRR